MKSSDDPRTLARDGVKVLAVLEPGERIVSMVEKKERLFVATEHAIYELVGARLAKLSVVDGG